MKKPASYFLTLLFCISSAAALPIFNLPTNVVGSLAGYFFATESSSQPNNSRAVMLVDTLGDYRSAVVTGNWNAAGSWERFDGVNWVPAVASPTSADGVITVRAGHTITISASGLSYDQVVVESTGQVIVAATVTSTLANGTGTDLVVNGTWDNRGGTWTTTGTWSVAAAGTYIHNTTSGIATPIGQATLDPASNFIYRGSSTLTPAVSFSGRTYGNLTLESTSGSYTVSGTGAGTLTINGALTVNSGVTLTLTLTGILNFNGNVLISGTLNYTGTSPVGPVNLKGNLNVASGATFNFSPGGTVPNLNFNGSTAQSISGTGNLTTNGSWSIDVSNAAGVNLLRDIALSGGIFTVSGSGRVNFGTNSISGTGSTFSTSSTSTIGIGSPDGINTGTTLGNIRVSGARTFTAGTTFIYNGAANQVVGNGLPATVTNLTIANTGAGGSNTVAGNSGQTVTGLLRVQQGIYSAASTYKDVQIDAGATYNATGTVGVSGNWTNNGTFTANSNGVTFNGTNQAINGQTTFFNLTKTTAAANTLTFEATKTQTVTNALTLNGAAGNLLSLRSSLNGTTWKINAPSTQSVSLCDAKDSDASGGQPISSPTSTDSGNNFNWTFAASAPVMTTSPGSLGFGNQNVGTSSSTQDVTINNTTGTAALNWSAAFSGADAAQFTIVGSSIGSIPAGGSGTVSVRFSPTSIGNKTANLVVSGNDTANPSDTISLTGTGVAPLMNVQGNSINIARNDNTPSTLDGTDFAGAAVAGDTVTATFTIQNTGNAPLTGISVLVGGTNASDFTVCTPPATSVAAGGSTSFGLTFNPSAPGLRSADIAISSNDPPAYTFAVQGTGTAPPQYRSVATGLWSDASTWEVSTDGGTVFFPAANSPTSDDDTITVRSPHTVTVNSNITVDQVTIDSGATVDMQAVSNLTVGDDTGTDLLNNGTLTVSSGILLIQGQLVNNSLVTIDDRMRIQGTAGGTSTYAWGASGQLILENFVTPIVVDTGSAFWPDTNGPQVVRDLGFAGLQMNVPRTVTTFVVADSVTGAENLTLNGNVSITTGGSVTGSPTYGPASTLVYFFFDIYGRGDEWKPGAVAGEAGVPHDVTVAGNTTLDLPNGTTDQEFLLTGELKIESGSKLTMAGIDPGFRKAQGKTKTEGGILLKDISGRFGTPVVVTGMTVPLRVLGGVNLAGGELELSNVDGGDLYVGGDWNNNLGTLSNTDRTVFFNGTGTQAINGTNDFGGFNISTTSARTITFEAGATNAIHGTLTLTGTAGNLLSLRSSSDGNQWNFSASTNQNVDYVDVKDSNASFGNEITATNSIDSGNNLNWNFGAPVAQTRYVATSGNDAGPNNCLLVGNPCATVANAIAQAIAGDTVSIATGTYTQLGIVVDKNLTFVGGDPNASLTIVRANALPGVAANRVFMINGGVTVSMSNFTIQNGKAPTGTTGSDCTSLPCLPGSNGGQGQAGGGILNDGTLTFTNIVLSGNRAGKGGTAGNISCPVGACNNIGGEGGPGGGVYSNGSLTVNSSTFTNNQAGAPGDAAATVGCASCSSAVGDTGNGGALNGKTLSVDSSLFTGNSADDGGAIQQGAAPITITKTTFTQNSGSNTGGAINCNGALTNTCSISDSAIYDNFTSGTQGGTVAFFGSSTKSISNSTITGNESLGDAGGVLADFGTVDITFVTIADNVADANNSSTGDGGGIRNEDATLNLKNSIVVDNSDDGGEAPQISGTITSLGYNHVESTTGGTFTPTTGDVIGSEDGLAPLANNGGPTQTRGLYTSSQAIDQIPNGTNGCGDTFAFDQRGSGFPRPVNGACDKGAFEGNLGTAPQEIDVTGLSVSIPDGDITPSTGDDTDFGSTATTSGTVVHTFTIHNSGTASLTISNPIINGTNPLDFTITGPSPTSPVAPGGTTTFQVTFDPLVTGLRSATVNIVNNDVNENPYNFNIQGTGLGITEPTVQASNIIFSNVQQNSLTATWTNGNGAARVVFGRPDSPPITVPVDGTTYTQGDELPNGDVVVYVGSGNTVTPTNIPGGLHVWAAVYEYNGSAGTENYLATLPGAPSNPNDTTTLVATYSWTGAAPGDGNNYDNSLNWNPNRPDDSPSDILLFQNGGTDNVNNVPTETIGQFKVSNNTTVNLTTFPISPGAGTISTSGSNIVTGTGTTFTSQLTVGDVIYVTGPPSFIALDVTAIGSNTSFTAGENSTIAAGTSYFIPNKLTITGNASGDDVTVAAGSQLNFDTTNFAPLVMHLNTGATASISGSMDFHANGNTTHRLFAADANGIMFQNGATFTGDAGLFQSPFGYATAGSAIFKSGSTYVFKSGGSPFGPGTGAVTIFQTGSLYSHQSTLAFQPGRTYANFELNSAAFNLSVGNTLAMIVDNLTITAGSLTITSTGTPGHSIKGNISAASGATLNFSPASASTFNLNGSSVQTISGAGTLTFGSNQTIDVNNPGVTLNRNVTMSGPLALTNGNISTGANTLQIGSTGSVSRTNGYVIGNLQKNYSAPGLKIFEVGTANGYSPVDVNVTTPSPGGAPFTVKAVQGAQPNIPTPSKALSRYWTLAGPTLTADLTFHYLDPADIPGTATEGNFVITKVNGGAFATPGGSVNTGANSATINGVSQFSDWTLAEPAALPTPNVNLSVSSNSGTEAGTTVITVAANASTVVSGAQTVNLGVSGTNITAGDYTLGSSTITIPSGQVQGSTTFTVVDDAVYEGPETATLTISSPSAGIVLGATTTQNVSITDNDTQPSFAFISATFLVNEGVGTASFQVSRSGALGGTDTVVASTVAGGTATGGASCAAGVDYITATQTLTFNPTDTNKTFDVVVCQDAVLENPNETINIALSNPLPNGILGTPNTAAVTINDDDGTGTTFEVDTLLDDASKFQCTAAANDCSLRGALSVAQDGDTIVFATSLVGLESTTAATLLLNGSELMITSDIEINGPGADKLTINGQTTSRIFNTGASIVKISGVSITGGNGVGVSPGSGGAILAGGQLTLEGVHIFQNTAGVGGGVAYLGGGPYVIESSTISNNTTVEAGGGVSKQPVSASPVDLTIVNSTISGNRVGPVIPPSVEGGSPTGGGIFTIGAGNLIVRNSTITGNSAQFGGGVFSQNGNFSFGSSIIAGNAASTQSAGNEIISSSPAAVSAGFNLIGNAPGDSTNTGSPIAYLTSDIRDVNPLLGPLQNNGGPTLTHKPAEGFPGHDKGCSFGSTTDQRGYPRSMDWPNITNGACTGLEAASATDIGSVELLLPTAANATISGRAIGANGRGLANVSISLSDMEGHIVRTARTNSFGYFTLFDVAVGADYVIMVRSKRYIFNTSSYVVSVKDNVTDILFAAE